MRKIVLRNYSRKPSIVVGHVILSDDGKVKLEGFTDFMIKQFERGVADWRKKRRIMIDEGEDFLDAVLHEYSGAYIRASEEA